MLNCRGQLGLSPMSPNKARAIEIERTYTLTIFLKSGHLKHERERPDMERTFMNSDMVQ